ncbi:hypothetical protein FRB94_006795 [Tulasnella sp. JGI-2019a]|nr:hypothetical protein FRB94_006795 [Tulasnella sp. JGI-2019a]
MSRIFPQSNDDTWPQMQDLESSLPPLTPASRRTSMPNLSSAYRTHNNQGSYSSPNTFESQRPHMFSSSVMNNVRIDISSGSDSGRTATNFNGNIPTAGEGTPQSPSFAFTSSGFTPPGQQSAMFASLENREQLLQSEGASPTLVTSQAHTPMPIEEELSQLRTKVRELEFVNDLVQLRVVELENERTKLLSGEPHKSEGGGPSPSGTLLNSPPLSDDFQKSWEQRTEARIKRFCSLNRAGNALCAWHDSRRERRAYPPRMAPPGTLNCGCTFEEALFEESLSRHRVGSYLPGETVRMDPALRNPLLKLMQSRYNYKDGDFERDPMTGRWVEGEGEQVWQQKASSGTGSRRKQSDSDSI